MAVEPPVPDIHANLGPSENTINKSFIINQLSSLMAPEVLNIIQTKYGIIIDSNIEQNNKTVIVSIEEVRYKYLKSDQIPDSVEQLLLTSIHIRGHMDVIMILRV